MQENDVTFATTEQLWESGRIPTPGGEWVFVKDVDIRRINTFALHQIIKNPQVYTLPALHTLLFQKDYTSLREKIDNISALELVINALSRTYKSTEELEASRTIASYMLCMALIRLSKVGSEGSTLNATPEIQKQVIVEYVTAIRQLLEKGAQCKPEFAEYLTEIAGCLQKFEKEGLISKDQISILQNEPILQRMGIGANATTPPIPSLYGALPKQTEDEVVSSLIKNLSTWKEEIVKAIGQRQQLPKGIKAKIGNSSSTLEGATKGYKAAAEAIVRYVRETKIQEKNANSQILLAVLRGSLSALAAKNITYPDIQQQLTQLSGQPKPAPGGSEEKRHSTTLMEEEGISSGSDEETAPQKTPEQDMWDKEWKVFCKDILLIAKAGLDTANLLEKIDAFKKKYYGTEEEFNQKKTFLNNFIKACRGSKDQQEIIRDGALELEEMMKELDAVQSMVMEQTEKENPFSEIRGAREIKSALKTSLQKETDSPNQEGQPLKKGPKKVTFVAM